MKHLTLYNTYAVRAATALAVLLVVAMFVYGGFMLLAVAHVAEMSRAETELRTLSTRLSGLESTYLAESATLTAERAQALGFVEPTEQFVVYAAPGTLSLNR